MEPERQIWRRTLKRTREQEPQVNLEEEEEKEVRRASVLRQSRRCTTRAANQITQ